MALLERTVGVSAGGRPDVLALRRAMISRHPSLRIDECDSAVALIGSLLLEQDSVELDSYNVRIEIWPLKENELPRVWETGGRIPWRADHHINATEGPGRGSCCVCLPDAYFLENPGPVDILGFLDGPVRAYFIGQALFERTGAWPHGEWGHGEKGRDEFYESLFGVNGPRRIRSYLEVLAVDRVPRQRVCPCGSGERIRHCHRARIEELRGSKSRTTWQRLLSLQPV